MRTVLLLLVVCAASASASDPATLRARAALALAFAPPAYAELHAKALRDGKPLVVWIGQPARAVPGCLSMRCDEFPGVAGPAVVVGVPMGGQLRRTDLPGRPTDDAVRALIVAVQ